MSEALNTEVVVGAAADLLTTLTNFPAPSFSSSALGQRLRALVADRIEQARQELFAALERRGGRLLSVAEGDEFIAITHRYMRAATEGVARSNIRLLANVIAGQIAEESVYASDFHRYANIISTLTTQETMYLGAMVRFRREGTRGDNPLDNFHTIEAAVAVKLRTRLVGTVHFPTDVAFRTCETALQRTGLVYRGSPGLDGGNDLLALSPDGEALARLAELEEAAP